MTTNSKRLLLTSLTIASIVAFAYIFRLSDKQDEKAIMKHASLSKESTGTKVPTVTSIHPIAVQTKTTSKVGPQKFFLANRQSGVIGLWGGNQVDNPVDNIFSVEINEPLTDKDAVWLTYRLRGVKDFSNVACSVNDRLAFGGYQVKTTDSVSYQRIQLSHDWLTKGTNRIHFGLPENAHFGYKVSDLSIEVLKGGAESPLIAQASPTSYKGMVYVHGGVTSCTSSRVHINGTLVKVIDNEFEALVPTSGKSVTVLAYLDGKPYSRFIPVGPNVQPDTMFAFVRSFERQQKLFIKGKANKLQVRNAELMVDRTSLKVTQKLSITSLRGVDVPAMDLGLTNVTEVNSGFRFLPHGEHFNKPATVAIKYDRTKIPDGYTENDIRTFYFDPNTKHWVALERDSVNKDLCMVVSKTTHFTDMINGVIKAPESPETQGYTPTMMNDIKVADPTSKIEMIAPPSANNMGSANLTYNLEMPPARGGISPNLAIQYNSDGGSGWLGEGWDLNVPSITVDTRWGVPRYDPKFETETYNMGGVMLATVIDANQSDTLGVVSVAHKGVLYERFIGKNEEGVQFHPIVESGFSRVSRLGSNPGNYFWKAISKDGLTYTYGGNDNTNSSVKGSVKTFEYENVTDTKKKQATKTVIAEWRLSAVEDQYRNFCRYYYSNDLYPIHGSTISAKCIQLSRIEIGRSKGNQTGDQDTIYQVIDFIQNTPRPKQTSNARYGFLTSNSSKLLDAVKIKQYEPNNTIAPVRSYSFIYKDGPFSSMLLDSVRQCDSANVEVASHVFSYYNNLSNKFYNTEETIYTTSVESGSSNTFKATTDGLPSLGGTKSENSSASFYLGVGAGFKLAGLNCGADVGGTLSYSSSKSDGKMIMIDINGDGLPDKVYRGKSGNTEYLCFIPNLGGGLFGTNGIAMIGYNGGFSFTKSTSNTKGFKGMIGAGKGKTKASIEAGVDELNGNSETPIYLSDVNGDGLTDIVNDGKVYFNTIKSFINGVAVPTFSMNSGITPRPIINIKSIRGKAGALKLSDAFLKTPAPSKNDPLSSVIDTSDAPLQRDSDIVLEEMNEDYEQIPMQDIVRFWEAPRTGDISISNEIKFLGDTSVVGSDGVRLAIQTNGVEEWVDSIKPKDNNLERSFSKDLHVEAGQRIYFRLQSGSTNFSDGSEDIVTWKQSIYYVNRGDRLFDVDGYNDGIYRSSEGSFVSQQYDNVIDSVNSSFEIKGIFKKPITSEPVTLKLYASIPKYIPRDSIVMETYYDSTYQQPDTSYIKYIVWDENPLYEPEFLLWDRTFGTEAEMIASMPVSEGLSGVGCPIHLRFEIESNTNQHWDSIFWRPEIHYIHSGTNRDTVLYAGVKYNIFEQKFHEGEGVLENVPTNPYGHSTTNYAFLDEPLIPSIVINSNRLINTSYILKMYDQYNNQVGRFSGNIVNNLNDPNDAFTVDVLESGLYSFSLYINDTISSDNVTASCSFQNVDPAVEFIPNIFCRQNISRTVYGLMWRGWGQFQYNAGNGRYAKPIIEDSLYLPQDTSQQSLTNNWDLKKLCLYNMSHKPSKNNYYWTGSNDYLLLKGDTICSGRLNCGDMPTILSPIDSNSEFATISENSASASAEVLMPNSSNNIVSINPTPNLSGVIYEISNAPKLSNRSKATTIWGGASVSIGQADGLNGGSYAHSDGNSTITSAFTDMNGDGFPDYITDNKVEYTNPNGGRDGEIAFIENEDNTSESNSWGFSGGYTAASYVGRNKLFQISSNLAKDLDASPGINGSYSKNNSVATTSYIDLNGDGLPDRVHLSDGKVYVSLNLGYGFSNPIDWGLTKISLSKSSSYAAGASIGGAAQGELMSLALGKAGSKFAKILKKINLGISLGINPVNTINYSLYSLFDVNMDGLPDKIYKNTSNKSAVEFNTGNGFTQAITMEEIEEFFKSYSSSIGYNLGINVSINILPWLRITLGASGNLGNSTDYTVNQMMDIDGDGYPDVVKANSNFDKLDELKVKRSLIGYTNKLKSVSNPLGGRIVLDYTRTQSTFDHPGGKWVMNSVSVNDGISDDGDSLINKFSYSGGKYDRYEREFLGFSDVTTENIDVDSQSTYRKTHQVYENSTFYTRGELLNSEIVGVNGTVQNKCSESTNKYHTFFVSRISHASSADTIKLGKYCLKPINPTAELTKENMFLHPYIIYTPLKYSKNTEYSYSGTTQSSLVTSESFSAYNTAPGTHGELLYYKYSDKGGLGENGTGGFNYQTNISYLRNKPLMTLFVLPTSVIVKGSDGTIYRKTEAVWFDNFANQLKIVKNVISAGDTAITTLGYDAWGNLSQEVLPGKVEANRMWYAYKYDTYYHLFPTEVSDKYDYKSYMGDYNYKFGIPCRTSDMNGNVMLTSLDNLGRVSTITGPNEVANGKPYTLKFEYHPQATISSGAITSPAYAVTKHYDEGKPSDDLETVSFSDGFGRAIQVNKDAYVNGAAASIISGRVKYDAFGRVVEAHYPTIETNLNNKKLFHATFDNSVPPTRTAYDVLDRVTSMTQPDGSITSTSYSITGGLLKTTVTDAMGGSQATFTNGSGLTSKTEQYSGPNGTITTTFEYDAINQLLAVTDTKGEKTESFYDLAGRRTKLIHPASGTTLFGYDQAGNLTSKKTANLALLHDSITYTYELYNRLKSIHYPQHPENDVTYTYGTYADTTTASGNRAGRLKYLVDGSGAQEFKYGRMGEITENRRTLVIPNQSVATYVTGWSYDSWNRVRTMTYPDGETLSYSYDLGGQLASLTGSKAGFSYPYVKSITYDRFEQRNYIKYGNDAETRYTYNDTTRNLMGLSVLSTKINRTLMSNAYAYDKVNNVLSVKNAAALPSSGIGGQMEHHYQYDGLYRLLSATGTYTGSTGKSASYTLAMGYDNLHNITSKKQSLEQNNLQFAGVLKSGYDLTYAYTNNPQQISTIADTSYRTDGTIVKTGKAQNYCYDANGNLLSVNTTQPAPDGSLRSTNSRRLLWDEENRLLSVSDNGFVSTYWYDASGERTLKMSGEGEGVLVNGILSGGRTGTTNYTAYVNPYLVITNGGQMSKHFYIGSQRVVSQLCSSGSMGGVSNDPQSIDKAAKLVVNFDTKYTELTTKVKTRFDSLGVAYNGKNNAGAGFWTYSAPFNETDQYYYHPDHLGSSSLITNLGGDLVQHIEYVPFGEVFVEERTSTWGTPYKFNAKELDEETGLYYYGARYYDARTSVWLGVDPLAEKYPGISSYVYCLNNPVKLVDPTGMGSEDTGGKCVVNLPNGATSTAQSTTFVNNEKKGAFLNDPDSQNQQMIPASMLPTPQLNKKENDVEIKHSPTLEAMTKRTTRLGTITLNSHSSVIAKGDLPITFVNDAESKDLLEVKMNALPFDFSKSSDGTISLSKGPLSVGANPLTNSLSFDITIPTGKNKSVGLGAEVNFTPAMQRLLVVSAGLNKITRDGTAATFLFGGPLKIPALP
jgi:RHS repeat-associated protein